MKHLVVLGAGTAGTMVVNKLRPRLSPTEWKITIVDPATEHHYQPGYLFIPFGTYRPDEVVKRFVCFTTSSGRWTTGTQAPSTTGGTMSFGNA